MNALKSAPAKVLSESGTDTPPVAANAETDLRLVLLGSIGTGLAAIASAEENAVLLATNKTPIPAAA